MYTEDDLVKIEQAITKLQMGERVVSVAYGDHIVKYAEVDLKDLLNLRSRIKSDLKSSTSSKRRITFATHKGIC
jgi:pyruvate/2-oxoglutarate dehydrogenase complex dihydrolipoamide acyltransferase (E2) component